ncbi:MAG: OadG family protein [Epsilonproteobacteria bacterium]|nr:OadG family protein [Campylobacterota bacterium]
MEVNYITEGLKFMLLGMSTVFLFLLVLVYILRLQESLMKKYFPQKEKTPAKSAVPTVSKTTQDDASVIAAITAAITEFKKK